MIRTLIAVVVLSATAWAQQAIPERAPVPGSAEDLVQQAQKLSRAGKQDEALALYRQAIEKSPNLYLAHLGAGIALDLEGKYSEAQEHLNKALETAPADTRPQVLRALAISYAFEGKPGKSADYESQVFSGRVNQNDWIGAAET